MVHFLRDKLNMKTPFKKKKKKERKKERKKEKKKIEKQKVFVYMCTHRAKLIQSQFC